MTCKGGLKEIPSPVWQIRRLSVEGGEKKFSQISAYFGLCGFVRNRGEFPQISVIFALRGVVGSRGRNIAAALAKSPLTALKVLREEYRRKVGRSPALSVEGISGSPHSGIRHFLRARFYHSTKFRLPAHFVLWESCWGCHPKPAFCGLRRLKKSTHERRFTAMKRYNTPHRHRVIKTRLTEEEYAEFSERVSLCKMSQAEFIRQALIKSSIRPVITVSPVNDVSTPI